MSFGVQAKQVIEFSMFTPTFVLSSDGFLKVNVVKEQKETFEEGTVNLGGVIEWQFDFHLK